MSIRGYCPKCKTPLTVDELRVNRLICPGCKTELRALIKANWVYAVLAVAVASLIAYLQGYQSIIFAFWALIYGVVILALIKFFRWELHLPITIVAVLESSVVPRDIP